MSAPAGSEPRRALGPIEWLLPALTALVLSIPLLKFGYLWDDYTFLNEAGHLSLRLFSPFHAPMDPFWRPISRQAYFAFLHGLGAGGPMVGHLLNLAFLATDVYLLVRLASMAIGRRRGLVAGTVFASLGVVPFLVGWVSGIQDLFAMCFILLGFLYRAEGRNGLALLCSAGALLCKETAAVFLPAIACVPWVQAKIDRPRARDLVPYLLLGIAWAAIHPGIRGLLDHRFADRPEVYVGGVRLGGAAIHVLRYLLTLLNLPQPDAAVVAPYALLPYLATAAAIVFVSRRLSTALPTGDPGPRRWPERRVVAMGLYLAMAPLVLTAAFVRGWQPYYAAIGGIGLSILVGVASARIRPAAMSACLLIFLSSGVWSRAQPLAMETTTEYSFRVEGNAIEKVRRGFLALHDQFPDDSRIVVSTQVRGIPGVYVHLYMVQALRQWYRNPTLQTVKPEVRRTRARPEFFFLVTPDLNVARVDPYRFAIAPESVPLDYWSGERAFRAYALGLYASNDVDAAVTMLTTMPEINGPLENSHRRLAAALLMAAGRDADAARLLTGLDSLPRAYALENIAVFLAEPLPGTDIDRYVLRAFGLRDDDREAWVWLARWSEANGYADSGLRYAGALERIDPRDPDLPGLTARLTRIGAKALRSPNVDDPPAGSGVR